MNGIAAPVSTHNLTVWWAATHAAHQRSNCVCTTGGVCGSIESMCREIEKRTRVSRSTMFRRIQAGTLTMDEADRFACALGTTPYRIWPAFDRAPVTAALTPSTSPYGATLF